MASLSTIIRITHAKNYVNDWRLDHASHEAREEAIRIADLFTGIACGAEPCTFTVELGSTALAKASATATIVTAVATNKITINAVDFVAIANGGTPTTNQWCVGAGGTADNDSATALAAAINGSASAKVKGYVTASSAAGVVTITAVAPGVLGNCVTLTASGAPITVSGSGFLAGGAGANAAQTSYDRS